MARAWRPLLAACAVTLAGGAAQAGEHVDWLDDGTVLLKLGPAYDNAVIETSRDQLGSLFSGPDAHPFAGATVRVLSQDEGPHGAISGPLTAFAPVFEELSGAKVELRPGAVQQRLLDHDARLAARHRAVRRDRRRRLLLRRADQRRPDPPGRRPAGEREVPALVLRRHAGRDPPALHLGRQGLRRAERRRRAGALLPPRHPERPGLAGQVQGGRRLRPAGAAQDLAAGARHRPLLRRQELRPGRLPAGPRHGDAPEAGRAGPLPLPVARRRVRHRPGGQGSTKRTTSSGSTPRP